MIGGCLIFSFIYNIPYKFQMNPLILLDSLINSIMIVLVLLLNLVLSHSVSLTHKIGEDEEQTLRKFYLPKVVICGGVFVSMCAWQYSYMNNTEKFFANHFIFDADY
jgi:hypothetical protein